MALESKIYAALTASTALTAIVSSGIYPIRARQNAKFPSIVYRRQLGDRMMTLGGYGNLENANIELEVRATAVTARRLTGDAAIAALISSTTFRTRVNESPDDEYDDETKLFRRIFNVSIWNNE